MFKLSICQPTYNRVYFIKDTTTKIIEQILSEHRENDVQLCFSDNGSTDGTKDIIEEMKRKYPTINFKINYFGENRGLDANHEQVMKMADGEWSILKGDDDYLMDGGLNKIFNLLDQNRDVDVIVSSPIGMSPELKPLQPIYFLREEVESLKVNFKDEMAMRNYFLLCNNILGLGTFISSVIYRTEAVKNVEAPVALKGCFYMSLFFYWNFLSKGKTLMYSKESYLYAMMPYASPYASGVKRDAIDFRAIYEVGDRLLPENLKYDFYQVCNRMYKYYSYIPRDQRKDFDKYLKPYLLKMKHPMANEIIRNTSSMIYLKLFIASLLSSKQVCRLKNTFK